MHHWMRVPVKRLMYCLHKSADSSRDKQEKDNNLPIIPLSFVQLEQQLLHTNAVCSHVGGA